MTDPTRRPNPAAGKSPAPRPASAQQPQAARPAAAQQQQRRAAPAPAPAPAPARRPIRRADDQGETLDATTKKGLIAAGVLVVIGAAVWIVIGNKKAEETRILEERNATVQGFKSDIEKVLKNDQATTPEIQSAIDRIDKETDKYVGEPTESEIKTMKSRLVGKAEDIKRRESFMEQFNAAKQIVDAAETKSSEDLRKAQQLLTDIEQIDSTPYGPNYPEQIKAMKTKIYKILVGKLRTEAKQFADASGTSPRQGLQKYAEAEDFIRKAMLDAKQAKSADLEPYTELYKGLLQESDEYSKRVVNKEFIESIPWKDLLGGEMANKWSKTTTVPGFACRIDNGILTVSPPDPGTKQQGVCGILDQKNDNLRHLMIDMEFSVDGVATMFFHVSPPPQNPDNRQSDTFDLSSKDGGLKPNEKYSLVATFIGSDLAIWFPQNDEIQRYENSPSWTKLRRGGLAFLIPEGTRLRVTRLRIRELR
jgi:hypothetical protein